MLGVKHKLACIMRPGGPMSCDEHTMSQCHMTNTQCHNVLWLMPFHNNAVLSSTVHVKGMMKHEITVSPSITLYVCWCRYAWCVHRCVSACVCRGQCVCRCLCQYAGVSVGVCHAVRQGLRQDIHCAVTWCGWMDVFERRGVQSLCVTGGVLLAMWPLVWLKTDTQLVL